MSFWGNRWPWCVSKPPGKPEPPTTTKMDTYGCACASRRPNPSHQPSHWSLSLWRRSWLPLPGSSLSRQVPAYHDSKQDETLQHQHALPEASVLLCQSSPQLSHMFSSSFLQRSSHRHLLSKRWMMSFNRQALHLPIVPVINLK